MAVTISTEARNAAAQAIAGRVDGGTLELTASGTAIVTFALQGPAFAAASGGTAAANGLPMTAPAGAGTIDGARIRAPGGSVEISGFTVGLTGSGADVELTSLAPGAGSDVALTTLTITQPAS